MSVVTPGSVAPRWPSSHARLRALVCDSDGRHGAMNTSAAANAAATGAGGSVPRAGFGGRIVSTASPPAAIAAASSASPIAVLSGSATTSTVSPARTRRQRSTTVVTACWSSLSTMRSLRAAGRSAAGEDPDLECGPWCSGG